MKKKNISKDLLATMYRRMEQIRQFELKSAELYQAGELPGFLHPCVGQEAAEVGVVSALRADDFIATTHRGHGHIIAKGADLKTMYAELFAKKDGICRGNGGSMHMMDRSLGIIGANGIVGQGSTLATGAALACQISGTDGISVCFMGDGAQNEGFFHESLNMASIWNLPIIFAIENNQYAESTPQSYHMRPEDVATRAQGYGIKAYICDGNNLFDVYNTAIEAAMLCRKGEGPVLLELKTYRWFGHYVGDPAVYRPKGELESWKAPDKEAFAKFRARVIEEGTFTEEELDKIRDEVTAEVDEAVLFGRNSEPLPPEFALENVYEEELI
ncbi:thiamine pyrophosphate-dependent dehydrogenase E1 component subunit alpha [Eubacteriales bacterium DFI.9.88]|nr:thiamine pyrophosphate-dependent dehydrogenase E1 component subunit alpha [Eubacteriales bacterium DFI.9.88]